MLGALALREQLLQPPLRARRPLRDRLLLLLLLEEVARHLVVHRADLLDREVLGVDHHGACLWSSDHVMPQRRRRCERKPREGV